MSVRLKAFINGHPKIQKGERPSREPPFHLDNRSPLLVSFSDIKAALRDVNLLGRGCCVVMKTSFEATERPWCRLGEDYDVIGICKVAHFGTAARGLKNHFFLAKDQLVQTS